jgi:uncharacterized protein (TIGR00288 family)
MSNHIAIFIDAENLTSWVKNGGVETLMDELRSLGQVVVRKAYGKWSTTQLAPLQSVLNENGFELIHTFHPVSGKNSTDIKMTVDTMEVAIESQAQWIVLATGDSDFSPLFRKLREQGKDVIGVGPKSPLSECVKNSCSRYIYTDNADEENADETERNNMLVSEKIDFIDILQSILQEEDGSIHLSALKSKMLERDNAFSEKRLGFKTFKDFVNATDFAEIKDDGNGTLVVSLVKKKVNVQEDAQMTLAKILKKKGWDVFPKATLRKIFKLVCDKTAQKSKSKQALVQEIASKNMVGTTSGIINRVLGIFYKAKLVKINGTEEEKLWKIEKNNKYWYEIDKAMLDRLAAGLKDAGFKAKESEIKALLYGRYTTDDEVHSLLSAYRGVIE